MRFLVSPFEPRNFSTAATVPSSSLPPRTPQSSFLATPAIQGITGPEGSSGRGRRRKATQAMEQQVQYKRAANMLRRKAPSCLSLRHGKLHPHPW